MLNKKCIVILSLLGDPEVSAGIPGTGGFNKTVGELLNILSKADIDFFVITNKNKYNRKTKSIISKNIYIHRIDFEDAWEIDQDMLTENFDVIIGRIKTTLSLIMEESKICLIHSFYWISGYFACEIKKRIGIPFIHTVVSLSEDKLTVGIKPHSMMQREIEKYFLPKTEMIFAITESEKRTLVGKYNIPANMIRVVGRSINQCFLDSYCNNKDIQLFDASKEVDILKDYSWWTSGAFLYVGRIVEIKGIKQIVAAWITAHEKYSVNLPLWLVGGTPRQIQEMRQLIMDEYPCLIDYENSKQLMWWGNLSSANISTLMRRAQALIMHSRFEAGGRVIIEAFSAGIPVIGTPYGFANDYIFDGYNGFLTEFNDIDHLATILKRFSDQPYLASIMGENAYKYMSLVQHEWNYERIHLDVYHAFLNKNSFSQTSDMRVFPSDLNSYKSRNRVTVFPYFDTDISNDILSETIDAQLGKHILESIEKDDSHANIYLIHTERNVLYMKQFYHVLTNGLTRMQYKNKYVISAQEQIIKSIASTHLDNIADITFYDNAKLLYVAPFYQQGTEPTCFDALTSLWKENKPSDYYIQLYTSKNFKELKTAIDSADDLMINRLFCAEIVYEELAANCILPAKVKQKINALLIKNDKIPFGLNYGKGIIGHTAQVGANIRFLPTHTLFIGELGFDIVLTFLQYNQDHKGLWSKTKTSQNLVPSSRLDLWFFLIVYALERTDDYPQIIKSILNF